MVPGPGPLLRPGRRQIGIPERVSLVLPSCRFPPADAVQDCPAPAEAASGGFASTRLAIAGGCPASGAWPASGQRSRRCSGDTPPGSGSGGSSGCRPSWTALLPVHDLGQQLARDAHADQEVVVLAGEQRRLLLDLADQADRALARRAHLRLGSRSRSPVWVNMWTMNRPPGSTNRPRPPMNRKLQAEKQAQPSGIRVTACRLADQPAGLVADPRVAAGRAQPDLVDRLIFLQRRLQAAGSDCRRSRLRRAAPARPLTSCRVNASRDRSTSSGWPGRSGCRGPSAACAAGDVSAPAAARPAAATRAGGIRRARPGHSRWRRRAAHPLGRRRLLAVDDDDVGDGHAAAAAADRPRSTVDEPVTPGRVSLSQVEVVPTSPPRTASSVAVAACCCSRQSSMLMIASLEQRRPSGGRRGGHRRRRGRAARCRPMPPSIAPRGSAARASAARVALLAGDCAGPQQRARQGRPAASSGDASENATACNIIVAPALQWARLLDLPQTRNPSRPSGGPGRIVPMRPAEAARGPPLH